jgi:hypothetical protein
MAESTSGATVVAFVAARSSDTVIVSNPHGSTVTGQIRIVPDAGAGTTLPVLFSLPGQGSQTFPNVLSALGVSATPAILVVEGSDTLSVSDVPLRLAFPDRPLTLPIVFNLGAPATGSLVLGILNGLVRVNIYEHATSVTPLVSRTYSAAGEQVMRFRYVDLLPAGVAISDGYATVSPLSGQAVALTENPPTRRRAAGRGAPPPPVLSLTGSPACEFTTGIHASVPSVAGATYRWTLVNATTGALTGSSVDLALGSQGYASLKLVMVFSGSTSTAETNIAIEGKSVYTSSSATSVTLGQDATIDWALAGTAPTSQTLSGTDFATVNLDPAATSYSYHPTTFGPKTYALSANNACGTGTANGDYSVSAACSTPHIDSFTNNGPVCAGSPAQLTWATYGSGTVTIDHGVGTVADSGSIAVSPAVTTVYTITKTASCGSDSRTTTVTATHPVITSLTASPSTVPGGGTSTITGNYTNGVSWTMRSSLDNSLSATSGSGASPAVVTYTRDIAGGTDTITFTVTDACGNTTSQTTTICSAIGITTSGPTTFCQGGSVTLTAYAGTAYSWSTGATTAAITVNATGTYSVTDKGGSGCTSTASRSVTVTNPAITSLTASPSTVPGGGTSTITGNYTNGVTWTMSSSLSNSLSTGSGSGAGPAVVTYTRDTALGADTITFTVTDACGNTTSQTTVIN